MIWIVAVLTSLLTISAIAAAILVVAWLDFERPRHALTWAVGFALLALLVAIQLGARGGLLPPGPSEFLSHCCGIGAGTANLIGFRQRAGLRTPLPPLLGVAALPLAAVMILERRGLDPAISMSPVDIWNATTFLLAGSTLLGRRRSEWAAESLAFLGLTTLALLCGGLALAKLFMVGGGGDIGLLPELARVIPPLLPGVVAGIALFTIFLLTADLADQTRRIAQTDMLTGLLNRRGFEEAAERLFGVARAQGFPLTLALIDLDRFKQVNDSFGHLAGDDVLVRFARTLSERAGRGAPLARVGGEEFALLMIRADLATATGTAERLRADVAASDHALPDGRAITASFGLAELDPESATLAELMARADTALYAAKAGGRNRVVAAPTSD